MHEVFVWEQVLEFAKHFFCLPLNTLLKLCILLLRSLVVQIVFQYSLLARVHLFVLIQIRPNLKNVILDLLNHISFAYCSVSGQLSILDESFQSIIEHLQALLVSIRVCFIILSLFSDCHDTRLDLFLVRVDLLLDLKSQVFGVLDLVSIVSDLNSDLFDIIRQPLNLIFRHVGLSGLDQVSDIILDLRAIHNSQIDLQLLD